MSSLVFLYAIFLTFLEGKLGHPFLEGKDGQRVQNLLQVTSFPNNCNKLLAVSSNESEYILAMRSQITCIC
ncbi:hypothetical protein [Nostoc sp.]|uniref:hypothetical protein n=1 Tax=Nostoc sp. TaxID=1180 RepID=UPI002FF961BF